MVDPWSAAIGVGGNLIGGLINTLSGDVARGRAEDMANNQMAMQMRMAQYGLQYRAKDAMNAYRETGIHPLAMLGVQGPSYTPVNYVGSQDNSMGDAVARSGQDLSRAITASSDRESRNALATRFDNMTVERMGLENEILKTRLASEKMRLMAPQVGPAAPSRSSFPVVDGQGIQNTELRSPLRFVKDDAMSYPVTPATPAHGPRAVPEVEWSVNSDGSYSPLMSQAYKQRTEDQMLPGLKHFFSNTIVPMFDPSSRRAPFPARPGYHWYIDYKGDWHHRRDASQRLKGAGWRD